jgi:hypothetical protein
MFAAVPIMERKLLVSAIAGSARAVQATRVIRVFMVSVSFFCSAISAPYREMD